MDYFEGVPIFKMKDWVVFINPSAYPCDVGGIEIFNYYLIKKLSEKDDLHLLTLCKKYKNNNTISVHFLRKCKFNKVTQPLQIFLFLVKNRSKIKILHISFSKAYWTHWFIYVIANRLLGITYIITIHGGSMAVWKPTLPYKLFFKYAESITGVSDRIINEYNRRSGREIIYTPPLIPFSVIQPKNKYRSKWLVSEVEIVLLYVGSLKPLKSVDTLIEALGLIKKEVIIKNKLKVLIAGDGISRKGLITRVKELGLEKTISFLGNIRREEIPELYNLADIYTICSEFEGLPISTLEAFANKIPCITSDAPGLNELSINNKNTLMFKTKDSSDYSKKIELLLNNQELKEELSENAYNFYKNQFSYQNLADKFKSLINKT